MDKESDYYSPDDIERIFANSVSDEIFQVIKDLKQPLSTKSKEYRATAFFADISGATDIEKMKGIEKSRQLISEVLEVVTDEAKKRSGYLDKYIGDSVMLLFGSPICCSEREQAIAASQVSLEVQKKISKMGINISIGFNTGSMSFGNYGPNNKPLFTPMGNDLNIASRMEEYSKENDFLPATTGYVKSLVNDLYRFAFICKRYVKYREEPVEIYGLIGEKDELSDDENSFWNQYDSAIVMLEKKQTSEALNTITKLKNQKPHDKLIMNAFDNIKRIYAEELGQKFSSLQGTHSLISEIEKAITVLFGNIKFGILEQSMAVDIIVNNAVIQLKEWKTVLDQEIEAYKSQFDSSVMQSVYMVKTFVPDMKKQKYGRVIGINTECLEQRFSTQSAYVSGKKVWMWYCEYWLMRSASLILQ